MPIDISEEPPSRRFVTSKSTAGRFCLRICLPQVECAYRPHSQSPPAADHCDKYVCYPSNLSVLERKEESKCGYRAESEPKGSRSDRLQPINHLFLLEKIGFYSSNDNTPIFQVHKRGASCIYNVFIMFSNPESNVEAFDLRLGMKVADFGAGSGFYSFAAAKRVGESGRVYAVDVQKDLLVKVKNEARKRGLLNVEVIAGDIEKRGGTRLRDGFLDAVIISNLLFQVPDKNGVADEAARVLKSGGKLLIVDWTDSFGGLGPAPDAVFDKGEAQALFESKGFKLLGEIPAGEHHFGIIMAKQ